MDRLDSDSEYSLSKDSLFIEVTEHFVGYKTELSNPEYSGSNEGWHQTHLLKDGKSFIINPKDIIVKMDYLLDTQKEVLDQ